MTTNAVLFGGTDPGRFCPTYMIFCESFTPHDQQPKQDQKFDRRDVYIITQNALADGTYMDYIRAHYNRSKQIDPPFFQEFLRGTNEIQQNYTTNFLARLAYQTLDKPLTELGARIEARRRKEGVYPPEEIYIPTPLDSERCYREYMSDVQQRLDHDQRFPNEPKQIKAGENVLPRGDGTVAVSGQVSVMSINGLLCKVIFDHCPSNEFFVEESFPLDWMYPYLSPFGVIMKINRQPVEEMTDEAVKRDHEFWSRYSERLIGNWMTYDTTVKEITDFVQKVYLQHDFNGFKGDRRFIRDEQAQKSFSKLRSAIGGSIYEWRFQHPKSGAEQQRMLKEANFALAQAFAFCPSSPEAVYHYVFLLVNLGRIDDALQVARTWQKLDPYNDSANSIVNQLTGMKNGPPPAQSANPAPVRATVDQMEKELRDHPNNFQNALSLVAAYMQMQRSDKATGVLDQVLASPAATQEVLQFVAEAYGQLGNFPKLEATVEKLTQLDPHSPEWWYNLAAIKLMLGKTPEALSGLRTSLDENAKRLVQNPKALNLLTQARTDPRFSALHSNAEFQQLVK
jgi:tetratricopeptide (TPR) repeat protein